MARATGEFSITSWDEETYQQIEGGGKLTRASVTGTFTGGVTGTGDFQWLMCYRPDGSARFVGLQRIQGSIDDCDGSVVFESIGDFDGTRAVGDWSVLADAGTGALAGLRGQGGFDAPIGSTAAYHLDYRVD
ncbi:MAG TPA: DUF3224 domain-containing protein [Mycobacteriales bacterium]|nr:DUF3224 domain-containing protein [Mycobacteriales bacterium]